MVHVEIRYIEIKSISTAGSLNIGTTLNIVERVQRPVATPQIPTEEPDREPYSPLPEPTTPMIPETPSDGQTPPGEIQPPSPIPKQPGTR